MKWKTKTWDERKQELEQWHKWFAWYPVMIKEIDGSHWNVWFKRVYRKGVYVGSYDGSYWSWTYKENVYQILADDAIKNSTESIPPKGSGIMFPTNCLIGTIHVSQQDGKIYVFDGKKWVQISK